jgi:hypothetical protein
MAQNDRSSSSSSSSSSSNVKLTKSAFVGIMLVLKRMTNGKHNSLILKFCSPCILFILFVQNAN